MGGMNDCHDFWRNIFAQSNLKNFDAQTPSSVEFTFNKTSICLKVKVTLEELKMRQFLLECDEFNGSFLRGIDVDLNPFCVPFSLTKVKGDLIKKTL